MLTKLILETIKLYQKFISANFGRNCRFYPSCSEYFALSIKKQGLLLGSWQGIKRLLRCHPWNEGGIDFP
jgi:putative membrane protein insertion efficiency factor